MGDEVEVYDDENEKWCDGVIKQIEDDLKVEWLIISYTLDDATFEC